MIKSGSVNDYSVNDNSANKKKMQKRTALVLSQFTLSLVNIILGFISIFSGYLRHIQKF